jgi:hypothetical protein
MVTIPLLVEKTKPAFFTVDPLLNGSLKTPLDRGDFSISVRTIFRQTSLGDFQ